MDPFEGVWLSLYLVIRLNNRHVTLDGGSLLGCVLEDVITPFGLALVLEGSLGRPFVSAAINGEMEAVSSVEGNISGWLFQSSYRLIRTTTRRWCWRKRTATKGADALSMSKTPQTDPKDMFDVQ